MTHQNLRLGKCWKLFCATLPNLGLKKEEITEEEKPVGQAKRPLPPFLLKLWIRRRHG